MADHTPITNRRQLLIGTSSLALTGAVTGALTGAALPVQALLPPALQSPDPLGRDPAHMAYYRVREAEAALRVSPNNQEAYNARYNILAAAEETLAETDATSLMGVRAKLKHIITVMDWGVHDRCIECHLCRSALDDLNQMIVATPPGWPGMGIAS